MSKTPPALPSSVTAEGTNTAIQGSMSKGTPSLDTTTETVTTITESIGTTSSSTADAMVGVANTSESMFSWGGYFQAIGMMILLLAALWFALYLLRRSGKLSFLPRNTSFARNALSIETQIALAPKKSLVVVRFLNSHVLLGVTEQNITYLKEVPIHDDQQQQNPEEPLQDKDNHGQPVDADAFKRALREAGEDTKE